MHSPASVSSPISPRTLPHRAGSPFPWMGGKSRLAKTIISLFPARRCYVEPFGGAANVMLRKPASKVEVYNDMSGRLVNFFRVLQHPDQWQALLDRLEWTPYSREEFARALTLLDDPDPVEAAWAFYLTQCQGISGQGSMARTDKGWGYSRTRDQAASFRSHVEKLPLVANRLLQVHIEHGDWRACIRRWDSKDTLFYLDPPYVPTTRSDTSKRYSAEMSAEDHDALVDTLLHIDGAAILSGYSNPAYARLEEAGWERRDFDQALSAAANVRNGRGSAPQERRRECLWLSP